MTGASRGIGKGVALELGRAGATVYVTGTSSSSSTMNRETTMSDDGGGPGTVEETARLVTEAGGCGIAVRCNHAVDSNVRDLFDRVEREQGRLDVLVNNAFRVPPGGPRKLKGKFWEKNGPEVWDAINGAGLRGHYVASCLAVPLMLKSRRDPVARWKGPSSSQGTLPRPILVMISSFGGLSYAFNVAYGVGKAGVDRMARDMALDLSPENLCVVSLYPGVVRTERTERAVQNGEWDRYVGLPLDNSETPQFTGMAVRALALDPNNMSKTGTCQVVAELAQEYGFFERDGGRPPSIRSLRFLLPTYAFDSTMRSLIPAKLIPDWKLPFWIMASGSPPPPPPLNDKEL